MNEVNALTTNDGTCAPAIGWPDAKREAEQLQASAAPPLAGRSRCRTCFGDGLAEIQSGPYFRKCRDCGGTDVERSVPANTELSRPKGGKKITDET